MLQLILFAVTASTAAAEECLHSRDLAFEEPAGSTVVVQIQAGSGDLAVRGQEGLGRVTLSGRACAVRADLLDGLRVDTSLRGDKRRIDTVHPEARDFEAWLDITVHVPASATVEIVDTTGSIAVTGVAALEIEDASGDITVEEIAGELSVRDGSGDINISRASGPVWIRDGSGDILINRASSVEIPSDGDGDIDITYVGADVIIGTDESGDIAVRNVRGDFKVKKKKSGQVGHEQVDGEVKLM